MSAFVVNNETINLIINWAHQNIKGGSHVLHEGTPEFPRGAHGYVTFDFSDRKECEKIGQMLLNENYQSVNARYRENDQAEKFIFKLAFVPATLDVRAIKQVFCLEYQSCEHDQWENSLAKKVLSLIKNSMTRKILDKNGYQDEPWGL
jgi:hypothetical protein